ncbi:MAG: hypothetical protein ACFFDN_23760 [Candidatus Hodarchaeota archaeon]
MVERIGKVLEEYFFLILGIAFTGIGIFMLIFVSTTASGYLINEGIIFIGFGICSICVFIFDR